jgi:hypothetical protein
MQKERRPWSAQHAPAWPCGHPGAWPITHTIHQRSAGGREWRVLRPGRRGRAMGLRPAAPTTALEREARACTHPAHLPPTTLLTHAALTISLCPAPPHTRPASLTTLAPRPARRSSKWIGGGRRLWTKGWAAEFFFCFSNACALGATACAPGALALGLSHAPRPSKPRQLTPQVRGLQGHPAQLQPGAFYGLVDGRQGIHKRGGVGSEKPRDRWTGRARTRATLTNAGVGEGLHHTPASHRAALAPPLARPASMALLFFSRLPLTFSLSLPLSPSPPPCLIKKKIKKK